MSEWVNGVYYGAMFREWCQENVVYDEDEGALFFRAHGDRQRARVLICETAGDKMRGFCKVGGKVVIAARIAWLLKKGDWPKFRVENVNGVPEDIRWTNLRSERLPEAVAAKEADECPVGDDAAASCHRHLQDLRRHHATYWPSFKITAKGHVRPYQTSVHGSIGSPAGMAADM